MEEPATLRPTSRSRGSSPNASAQIPHCTRDPPEPPYPQGPLNRRMSMQLCRPNHRYDTETHHLDTLSASNLCSYCCATFLPAPVHASSCARFLQRPCQLQCCCQPGVEKHWMSLSQCADILIPGDTALRCLYVAPGPPKQLSKWIPTKSGGRVKYTRVFNGAALVG